MGTPWIDDHETLPYSATHRGGDSYRKGGAEIFPCVANWPTGACFPQIDVTKSPL